MALRFISRLASLSAFLGAAFIAYDYPLQPAFLVLALAIYATLLARDVSLWLLFIPALVPVLDLAPWTGRLVLAEFDAVLLVTAAIGLWQFSSSSRDLRLFSKGIWVLFALGISAFISAVVGYPELAASVGTTSVPYFLPENALRVGKSIVYALMLLPAMKVAFERDANIAFNRLTQGMLLGLAGVGLTALWEKGIVSTVFTSNDVIEFLRVALNFSGSYRITGMFSGMHTGGEAIDGFVALAIPFGVYAVARSTNVTLRVWALTALLLGTYAMLVTFTRATYLSVGVGLAAMLIAALAVYAQQVKSKGSTVFILLGVAAILAAQLFAIRSFAGLQAFFAALIAVGLIWSAGRLLHTRARIAVATLVVTGAFLGYNIHDDMLESRYASWSAAESATLSFLSVVVVIFAGLLSGHLCRQMPLAKAAGAVVSCLAATAVIFPALGGFTVSDRFSTVTTDMGTRLDHWMKMYEVLDTNQSLVIGKGVGTIPLLYHLSQTQDKTPRGYHLKTDPDGEQFVHIQSGSMTLTQRIQIASGSDAKVTILARSSSARAGVSVSLCPRNILYFGGIGCQGYALKPEANGTWQTLETAVQAGKAGNRDRFTWPMTFHLSPRGSSVDVAAVSLVTNGREILANRNFSNGTDRWFTVSDYDHLPWHAKNNYLHTLIEQGVAGLVFFLGFLLVAAYHTLKLALQRSTFAIPVAGTIAAFAAVGMFGSPLDMPRIATLAYVMLCIPLVARASGAAQLVPITSDTPVGTQDPVAIQHSEPAGDEMIAALEDLTRLHEQGVLDEEAFSAAKERILRI